MMIYHQIIFYLIWYQQPIDPPPRVQGPLDTIDREIWTLNSQYFVFDTQNRVGVKHIPFWGVFFLRTRVCMKNTKC